MSSALRVRRAGLLRVAVDEQVAAGFELREFGADGGGKGEALGDVEAVEGFEFTEAGVDFRQRRQERIEARLVWL